MTCSDCKKYCRIHEIFGRKVEATEEVEKYITKEVNGVEEEFLWYEAYVCDGCIKMAETVDAGVLNLLFHVIYLVDKFSDIEVLKVLSENLE